MFADRLNKVMDTVGASASDIARCVGCDRSNICRMRRGSRVPKKGASSLHRLVDGIYAFAGENGGVPVLCELIGCEEGASAVRVRQSLADWLYEGVNMIVRRPRRQKKSAPYARMGGRLNAVMELAELSNVRFGQLLNLDASYISRFRNGLRSPASNQRMMDDICGVLLKRLIEQEKLAEFAALINAPQGKPEDEEEAFFMLHDWLFDTGREVDAPAVEKLLENIGSFMPRAIKPIPPSEDIAERSVLPTGERIYYGTDGLRNAVLRFLSEIMQREMKELYLYSDQNLEWMTGDAEFSARLSSLLLGCLRRGARIKIIHTIDRTSSEMLRAISSWLPLYMSGSITSYYFRRKNQSRFSYTLFLCPGCACVEGGGVVGVEDRHGIYRYDTDPAILEAHHAAFDAMLATSKPLVNIYDSDDAERLSVMGGGSLSVIGSGLPVSTLSEDEIRAMLVRAGVSGAEYRKALTIWHARRSVLLKNLSGGYMDLYGVLADGESIAAGRVPVDLPGFAIDYTPDEYAAQVRSVLSLMDSYQNFRFFIMSGLPFDNVQIAVAENSVAVSRLKSPRISFLITHPLIREAFSAYVGSVKESCVKDEDEVRARLWEYL